MVTFLSQAEAMKRIDEAMSKDIVKYEMRNAVHLVVNSIYLFLQTIAIGRDYGMIKYREIGRAHV